MSVTWTAIIAVIVIAQKLLPTQHALDLPVAVAMIGFALLILVQMPGRRQDSD